MTLVKMGEELLQLEKRSFIIIVTEPMLGSWPANEDLFTRFVKSKGPAPELADDEIAPEDTVTGMTVFPRDRDGIPHLFDYHIKGFLKEAGNNLAHQLDIAALRSKIGNFIFPGPRRIYMRRPEGTLIVRPDDIKERPLRGQTMQGPRTTLVASEVIEPPIHLEIEIALLKNKWVDWKDMESILAYGIYQGLCQWRNAGWGRFECYEDDSKRTVIGEAREKAEKPKRKTKKQLEEEAKIIPLGNDLGV